MSAIAVPTSSISQGLQSYFHERNSDLSHLAKALKAGNLDAAQQEYSAIQTLGQSGPFANGDAFTVSQRQQYFDAIGQALQNGDLAAARQALVQLRHRASHDWDSQPAEPESRADHSQPESEQQSANYPESVQ